MPNDFKEVIQVQVGYFEPESITLTAKGFYPAVLLNVPRAENKEFRTRFDDEFEKKKNERETQIKRAQLLAKATANGGDSTVTSMQVQQQQTVIPNMKSLEQIQSDIEKELDRQIFCKLI